MNMSTARVHEAVAETAGGRAETIVIAEKKILITIPRQKAHVYYLYTAYFRICKIYYKEQTVITFHYRSDVISNTMRITLKLQNAFNVLLRWEESTHYAFTFPLFF